MLEVFVLVSKRKSALTRFFAWLMLAIAIVFLLFCCVTPIFGMPAFLFGLIWALLIFGNNVEYEYSYFDGDVRFAKILNKSRRKRLKGYTMDEVITIAPAGDRSIYKYENDKTITRVDYTSRDSKGNYYNMVVKNQDKGLILISYEPDEKYLDAVCMKYPQKVVRRQG